MSVSTTLADHDHPAASRGTPTSMDAATPGERAADRVAAIIGSWRFILIQTALLIVWMALNVVAWMRHWDPYPFILMNLALSMQAAFAGPIILMSQNRQAQRDRIDAHRDLLTDQKAEKEIRRIIHRLDAQDEILRRLLAAADPPPAPLPHMRDGVPHPATTP